MPRQTWRPNNTWAVASQNLYAPTPNTTLIPSTLGKQWRQPAAQQYGAVSGVEFCHCTCRHLSVTKLVAKQSYGADGKGSGLCPINIWGKSESYRSICSCRLGIVQRTTAADRAIYSALLAAWHAVWRRWQKQFRTAQSAGLRSYESGERSRADSTNNGRTRGEASVTLLSTQLPSHAHTAHAGVAGNAISPDPTKTFGSGGRGKPPTYGAAPPPNSALMSAQAVGLTGGNQPHNNLPPYLTLNFIIAMNGIYPARS